MRACRFFSNNSTSDGPTEAPLSPLFCHVLLEPPESAAASDTLPRSASSLRAEEGAQEGLRFTSVAPRLARHVLPNLPHAAVFVEGKRHDCLRSARYPSTLSEKGKSQQQRTAPQPVASREGTASDAVRELTLLLQQASTYEQSQRIGQSTTVSASTSSAPRMARHPLFVRSILEQAYLSIIMGAAGPPTDGDRGSDASGQQTTVDLTNSHSTVRPPLSTSSSSPPPVYAPLYAYAYHTYPVHLRMQIEAALVTVVKASPFSFHLALERLVNTPQRRRRHPVLALELFLLWWYSNPDQIPVELPQSEEQRLLPHLRWPRESDSNDGAGEADYAHVRRSHAPSSPPSRGAWSSYLESRVRVYATEVSQASTLPQLHRAGGILEPQLVFTAAYRDALRSRVRRVPFKKLFISSPLLPRVMEIALTLNSPAEVARGQTIVRWLVWDWIRPLLCEGGTQNGAAPSSVLPSQMTLSANSLYSDSVAAAAAAPALHDPCTESFTDWAVLTAGLAAIATIERYVVVLSSAPRRRQARVEHSGAHDSTDTRTAPPSVEEPALAYEEVVDRVRREYHHCVHRTILLLTTEPGEESELGGMSPTATSMDGVESTCTSRLGWVQLLFTTVLRCFEECGTLERHPARRPPTAAALWYTLHRRLTRLFPHVFHSGSTVSTMLAFLAVERVRAGRPLANVSALASVSQVVALHAWKMEVAGIARHEDARTPRGGDTIAAPFLGTPLASHRSAAVTMQRPPTTGVHVSASERQERAAYLIQGLTTESTCLDDSGVEGSSVLYGGGTGSLRKSSFLRPNRSDPARLHAHQRRRRAWNPHVVSFTSTRAAPVAALTCDESSLHRHTQDALDVLEEVRSAAIGIVRDHVALPLLVPPRVQLDSVSESQTHPSEGATYAESDVGEAVHLAGQTSVYLFVKLLQTLSSLGEAPAASEAGTSLLVANASSVGTTASLSVMACVEDDLLPYCHAVMAGYLRKVGTLSLARSGASGARALLTTYRHSLDLLHTSTAWERLVEALLWSTLPASEVHLLTGEASAHVESASAEPYGALAAVVDHRFGAGSLAWRLLYLHREELLQGKAERAQSHSGSVSHRVWSSVLALLQALACHTVSEGRRLLNLAPLVHAVVDIESGVPPSFPSNRVKDEEEVEEEEEEGQQHHRQPDSVSAADTFHDVEGDYIVAWEEDTFTGVDHTVEGGVATPSTLSAELHVAGDVEEAALSAGTVTVSPHADASEEWAEPVEPEAIVMPDEERDGDGESGGVEYESTAGHIATKRLATAVVVAAAPSESTERTQNTGEENGDQERVSCLEEERLRDLRRELAWCSPTARHVFFSTLQVLYWALVRGDAAHEDTVLANAFSCPRDGSEAWLRELAVYYDRCVRYFSPPLQLRSPNAPIHHRFGAAGPLQDIAFVERLTVVTLTTCPDRTLMKVLLAHLCNAQLQKASSFRAATPEKKAWVPRVLSTAVESALCQLLVDGGVTPTDVLAWRVAQSIVLSHLTEEENTSHHVLQAHVMLLIDSALTAPERSAVQEDSSSPLPSYASRPPRSAREDLLLLGSVLLLSLEGRWRMQTRVMGKDGSMKGPVSSEAATDYIGHLCSVYSKSLYYIHTFLSSHSSSALDGCEGTVSGEHKVSSTAPVAQREADSCDVVLPSQQLVAPTASSSGYVLGGSPLATSTSLRDAWTRRMSREQQVRLRGTATLGGESSTAPSARFSYVELGSDALSGDAIVEAENCDEEDDDDAFVRAFTMPASTSQQQ